MRAASGQDAAAVEEDRRQVEPGRGHQHARQGLVAAGEGDQGVEALGVHHRLHRVGDDLPADQRGPHALVAHGDPVGHGDGHELDREAAGVADALLGPLGQAVEGQVARRHLVPRRGHADLGLVPVVVGHADGAQHGPGRGPLETVGDLAAAGLHVTGHGQTLRRELRRRPQQSDLRAGSALPQQGARRLEVGLAAGRRLDLPDEQPCQLVLAGRRSGAHSSGLSAMTSSTTAARSSAPMASKPRCRGDGDRVAPLGQQLLEHRPGLGGGQLPAALHAAPAARTRPGSSAAPARQRRTPPRWPGA